MSRNEQFRYLFLTVGMWMVILNIEQFEVCAPDDLQQTVIRGPTR